MCISLTCLTGNSDQFKRRTYRVYSYINRTSKQLDINNKQQHVRQTNKIFRIGAYYHYGNDSLIMIYSVNVTIIILSRNDFF